MKTGIQVSSFKPVLKTEEQVRTAFEKMAAMGCGWVQLQWIDPAVSGEFIGACLKDTGIRSVGVQDFYQLIRENKAYYMELNEKTGGTWMCVSRIPQEQKNPAGLEDFIRELEEFQRELEPWGQKLCLHPVSGDFEPIGGVDPVEYILQRLEWLNICADLYHLNRVRSDMPGWLRRYAGRVCMVHFKESRNGTLVPPGQGDIDWTGVFPACRDTGVEYGFAEQESWEGDPFDRLKEGFDWVNEQNKKSG